MNLIKEIESLKDKISGKISFNVKLDKFSWFNLGGPAKILFKPESLNELSLFLKIVNKRMPIKILGRGSNTLIRDGGYNGIIIRFGEVFSHISLLKEDMLVSGSSASDKNVSNFALKNSLSGFEFLSCIPGTIGGAIKMNSGCYGENLSKILLSVQVMDHNGNLKVIPSSRIKFSYRNSDLDKDLIFISATLRGNKKNKNEIEKKMKKFIKQKKKTQPSNIKTCGSTFKNPEKGTTKKAWQLIKEAKCENMKFGDAMISEKHCNFFVNMGGAKSKDLEDLITAVKKKVYEKTGINLETEIQIMGEHV